MTPRDPADWQHRLLSARREATDNFVNRVNAADEEAIDVIGLCRQHSKMLPLPYIAADWVL